LLRASGSEFDTDVALVLGVARLGEEGLRGWWRSHGLGQAGRYILRNAFPRTWRAAALELDIASASRRHDDALGRSTAAHLFSDQLPFRRKALAWLADQKTADRPGHLLDQLEEWDEVAVIESLHGWASRDVSGEVVGGGLLLGSLSERESHEPDIVRSVGRQLAAAYLNLDATFRAPYFDLVP